MGDVLREAHESNLDYFSLSPTSDAQDFDIRGGRPKDNVPSHWRQYSFSSGLEFEDYLFKGLESC